MSRLENVKVSEQESENVGSENRHVEKDRVSEVICVLVI